MKKFLLRLGLFALICVGLISLMAVYAFLEPPNRKAYMYAHRMKMDVLDTVPAPRVVLVAGSSVAFGFNGEKLGRELAMNVVNAGLNSGIGLRFILDDIAPRLKPGDIVVLAPELELYESSYYGSNEALTSAVIYSGLGSARHLNLRQMLVFFAGLPSHFRLNHSEPSANYNSSNFNAIGDEVHHLSQPSVTDLPRSAPFKGDVDRATLADFKSKIIDIRNKGCRVVLVWPTCIESYYKASLAGIDKLAARLDEFGLTPAVPTDYFVEPDSLVFDTPYHLNAAGADENTRRLISILRVLNGQAEGVEEGGGDSHVDDHAYNIVGDGYEGAGCQRRVNLKAFESQRNEGAKHAGKDYHGK